MAIFIGYCIGVLLIILPKPSAKLLAEVLDQITKHKYGPTPEQEKKVRPAFSILVGLVVLFLTYLVDSKSV